MERPFLLLVNQVLTLCSVIPSVSPSGPLMGDPLFIVSSASLHNLASSTLCSRVGKWFCVCVCTCEGGRGGGEREGKRKEGEEKEERERGGEKRGKGERREGKALTVL